MSEQHRLTVRGKMTEQKDADYIYRGIAGRSFERRFDLADYIEVLSATFEMGLLTIELKREVPERLKPRTVEIQEPSKQAGTEAALAAA